MSYNRVMLTVVGTPIGNLEDVSYRQARTLTDSDIILAEDTRSAQTLLHAIEHLFAMKPKEGQKIISYYKEKEFEKLPGIIDDLEAGKTVSLISEAGMPVISDPGFLLISTVIKKGLPYEVIPGPSAVTTALLHSGIKFSRFMFLGFLPKKELEFERLLINIRDIRQIANHTAFIAFESPHRINQTLSVMEKVFPDAEIVIARELTKKFEEIFRGKAAELKGKEYRGEITLIFS